MNIAFRLMQSASIAVIALAGLAGERQAEAAPYVQTNLVADISGLAAITDPQLVNPWGVSFSATSPFWVSNQGQNSTTLYSVTNGTSVTKVNINPPTGLVSIPTAGTGPQGPTGQVSNANTSSFVVPSGTGTAAAHFIFANLNGTISAWASGQTAIVKATTQGAIYTGLAINTGQTQLYAANDAGAGSIDVFDSNFAPVNLGAGAFANPFTGLVPFNVRDIGGKVYVTYAPPGRASQTGAALGDGAVAVFDESGKLLDALINGSHLAAPWGIALAPADFGPFSNDLLIGNFSYVNSGISAFDPATGAFLGSIPVDAGTGNTPGGLWDLTFGNGGSGGNPDVLYFADGIDGETAGLFGAIAVVPEPPGWVMLAAGIGLLAVCCRRLRVRDQREPL